NYVGEGLEPLNFRELQSIEQQLETALKRVRTRKNQVMHESFLELHNKERALQEQNTALSKKCVKFMSTKSKDRWLLTTIRLSYPFIQMWKQLKENEMNDKQQNTQAHAISKVMMPPWLLRHMNE
ncbi:hypothetical protein M8C21_008238, partial [Ambrosia artemisiifolia]